jgi:hypothetical protein
MSSNWACLDYRRPDKSMQNRARPNFRQEPSMTDSVTLAELDAAIAVVQDNLRELVEQAAAYSGAADEERNADRIATQQAKLDALLAKRAALVGNG